MAVRVLRCSKCDGAKVDEKGNACHECNGEGFFLFGEDRDRDEIEAELAQSARFRDEDEAELSRAAQRIKTCPAPQRAGVHKQIGMLRDSLVYWKARVSILETELGGPAPAETRFTLESTR